MATVLRRVSIGASPARAPRRLLVVAQLQFGGIQSKKDGKSSATSLSRCLFSTTAATATRQDDAMWASFSHVGPARTLNATEKDFQEDLKDLNEDTKLKLGKTITTLRERLPTILQKPLPNDILAPNISLHLFPSTHPYLPVANGRAAYKAALWTSPLAWNRVPIIGNVGLEIQTIRVMTTPLPFTPLRLGSLEEMLVVRWITEPSSLPSEFLRALASRMSGGEPDVHEFMGLFVFQFDREGRILDHTIESAEHSRRWSRGMGSRVVRLTDRILGGIRGDREPGYPLPTPYNACLNGSKKDDDQSNGAGEKA